MGQIKQSSALRVTLFALLAIILMVPFMGINTAYAANESAQLTVGDGTTIEVEAGDSFTIPIWLTDFDDIKSADLLITGLSEGLSIEAFLQSYEGVGSISSGAMFFQGSVTTHKLVIASLTPLIESDLPLFYLQLSVAEDATPGTSYELSAESAAPAGMFNGSTGRFTPEITPLTITVAGDEPISSWWSFNSETGELILQGLVPSMTGQSAWPWHENRAEITTVTFADNTTATGHLSEMFRGMTNLTTINGLENFNTSNASSMARMFQGCSSLTSLDLSTFDTSNLTTSPLQGISGMFADCTSLKSLDISGFDTTIVGQHPYFCGDLFKNSSIEELTVSSLFRFSPSSGSGLIPALGLWTPDGTNSAGQAFTGRWVAESTGTVYETDDLRFGEDETYRAQVEWWSFNSETGELILEGAVPGILMQDEWPWHEVREEITTVTFAGPTWATGGLARMFMGCTNLTTLNGLENFDTSNAISMACMFMGCSSLTSLDLSTFDTSGLVMSMYNGLTYMFKDCTNLKTLNISSFDSTTIEWYPPFFLSMLQNCPLEELTIGSSLRFVSSSGTSLVSSLTIWTPNGTNADGQAYTGKWVAESTGVVYHTTNELPFGEDETYKALVAPSQ